jgi:hypothetical protein
MLREIVEYAHLASNRSAIDMLKVLEKKGYFMQTGKIVG